MGTQDVDDGEEALTGVTVPPAQGAGGSDMMGSIDAITWYSETITVIPKIAAGAKYTVTIGTTTPMVEGSGTGASTDKGVKFKLPDYGTGHAMEGTDRETTVTVTVTAANGYHDHEYSFDVSRAAPVGDELAGLSVRQGTFSGTVVALDPVFDADEDEYRVSIPATVMSLHLAARLDDVKQEGMTVVTHNNDGTTSEIDRAPSRTSDAVTMHRFDVPVGGTTIARSIVLTVISEDEEKREIEININRSAAPPTVTLTLTPTSISEAGGTSTLMATVSPASATAFAVTVSAVPVGAVTMSATTLSFAANAASATAGVTITAVDNAVVGANPTVTVSGATPSGVTAPADVMLTITDDDDDDAPTTPTVTMSLAPTSISEAGETSTLTATVSPASATAFDVTVSAAPTGAVTMSAATLSLGRTQHRPPLA